MPNEINILQIFEDINHLQVSMTHSSLCLFVGGGRVLTCSVSVQSFVTKNTETRGPVRQKP